MLVQAASSIARERLLGSTSRRGGDGGGRGRRGGDMQDTLLKDGVRDSPSLTEASSLTGGVEALTGWLEGRSVEVGGASLAATCRFSRWFVNYRAIMVVLSLASHRSKIVDRVDVISFGEFSYLAGVLLRSGGGDRGLRGRWYCVVTKSNCHAFHVVPEG